MSINSIIDIDLKNSFLPKVTYWTININCENTMDDFFLVSPQLQNAVKILFSFSSFFCACSIK